MLFYILLRILSFLFGLFCLFIFMDSIRYLLTAISNKQFDNILIPIYIIFYAGIIFLISFGFKYAFLGGV